MVVRVTVSGRLWTKGERRERREGRIMRERGWREGGIFRAFSGVSLTREGRGGWMGEKRSKVRRGEEVRGFLKTRKSALSGLFLDRTSHKCW